jgi:hypothetical protein
MDDYFSGAGGYRQVLVWTVATRVQLERWEPLVAAHVKKDLVKETEFPSVGYWQMHYEWHFCLIAARNLIGALDLLDSPIAFEQIVRDEIIETRDLNEHWKENMPVFNTRPRTLQPARKTGKSFAARNPNNGPYGWFNWNSRFGALLTPNVPAPRLRQLLEQVLARMLADRPELAAYIPAPAASPWIDDPDVHGWWPR